MSPEEVRRFPVVISLTAAAPIWLMSRATAYRRAAEGTFPVKVHNDAGRAYVLRSDVLRKLGIEDC